MVSAEKEKRLKTIKNTAKSEYILCVRKKRLSRFIIMIANF